MKHWRRNIEKRQPEKGPQSGPTTHSILLTGGGTGGHLAIVQAVKEELLRRGIRPHYIGSESGQDRAWFGADEGFAGKLFLPTRGVVNQKGLGRLASLAQAAKGTLAARRYMKAHGVTAVLSVGGFSAAPASFAALAGGVPFFIHEQNAVSGRLNRLLKPYARRFFSSYGGERVDYPVRDIFFETARTRQRVETVIFLGGSQGAKAINDFALKMAPVLAERGIRIVHQAGRNDIDRVAEAYAKMGIEADLFDFHPDLYDKIAAADLAVARAGASTLWELAANRLPALFVPYPYAAGDHQYHNALFLAEKKAGWVVRQKELKPENLLDILGEGVAAASGNLEGIVRPGGAAAIVDAMLAAATR